MSPELRVTLVAASLRCGGAERVVQLLARGLLARRHKVKVVTTTQCDDFYELPRETQRVRFDLVGRHRLTDTTDQSELAKAFFAIGNLRALRNILHQDEPDVIIAFGDEINIVSMLVSIGTSTPIVVTEHNDPRNRRTGMEWKFLRRALYPFAHRLVCVSAGVDEQYSWMNQGLRVVIHNPVDHDAMRSTETATEINIPNGKWIVGMGRLIRDKGFDLLLEAFARLEERHDHWSLLILGDGEELDNLKSQSRNLGLSGRVNLPGALKNPFQVLRQADFFVLPSRSEGFGNVLVEAMACGLPTVSFACPSGPTEIVIDGCTGSLVQPEDVDGLSVAMQHLMEDESLRRRMGSKALIASRRWSLSGIINRWESSVFLPLRGRA